MADVITVVDIKKYEKADKAVFPSGTIITPSAKDWANEHKIEIFIGDGFGIVENKMDEGDFDIERKEYLKQVVKVVIKNFEKSGGLLRKEDLAEIVFRSLIKLGFRVE